MINNFVLCNLALYDTKQLLAMFYVQINFSFSCLFSSYESNIAQRSNSKK